MSTNKLYLTVALIGSLWLPSTLFAACNNDSSQTGAVSVYSLSGQGNFTCADLNMNAPVSGYTITECSPPSVSCIGWTGGTPEVDTVVIQDSSGKRCVYNYGPGAADPSKSWTGLTPPADKPIAGWYFCADGDVQEAPNMPPQVTITAPDNFASFTGGTEVPFEAEASDPDGDSLSDIAWTSSLDGFLGYGAMLPVSDLSAGIHVITAQVREITDPVEDGLIASASIEVEIEAIVAQNCILNYDEDGVPVSVDINGVTVTCPTPGADDQMPRLVCSADLSTDADKFQIGSAACCLCNAEAYECDADKPELLPGEELPAGELPPCPNLTAENKGDRLQVPTTLMFNNDPYYCYTVGGKRTCFAY